MCKHPPLRAVFPGMFDPPTNGHLDIIRRAGALFDELIVAVGDNPDKPGLLEAPERMEILRKSVASLPRVRVEAYRGLTVDFVRRIGATVILRGIRNSHDMLFELQMAMTNRAVTGVETLFVMAGPEHAFTSSSLIRQMVRGGGDVSSLVPAEAMPYLAKVGPKRK